MGQFTFGGTSNVIGRGGECMIEYTQTEMCVTALASVAGTTGFR